MPHETRRLRIQNSGPAGKALSVTDAATGEPFPVTAVEYRADVAGLAELTVTTFHADVDVTADAKVIRLCPGCGMDRATQGGIIDALAGLADTLTRIADAGGGHVGAAEARRSAATLRAAAEAFCGPA